MNDKTREEVLGEIEEMMARPPVPENAITVKMLVDRNRDISEKRARDFLNKQWKAGNMGRILVDFRYYYYPLK